ncbi:MAG: DUF883 domain-containing protein [Verrucomicrobia bacterium]|nr:DUF883 domain-containing protein [Verrucomicrobiota bacterium]
MTTQEANDRLLNDLRLVVRDAEDLLKATADQTGEKIDEVRTRLTKALSGASTTCERLQERTADAAKVTDRLVREHPYESIGFAFGAGLLIGVLLVRR